MPRAALSQTVGKCLIGSSHLSYEGELLSTENQKHGQDLQEATANSAPKTSWILTGSRFKGKFCKLRWIWLNDWFKIEIPGERHLQPSPCWQGELLSRLDEEDTRGNERGTWGQKRVDGKSFPPNAPSQIWKISFFFFSRSYLKLKKKPSQIADMNGLSLINVLLKRQSSHRELHKPLTFPCEAESSHLPHLPLDRLCEDEFWLNIKGEKKTSSSSLCFWSLTGSSSFCFFLPHPMPALLEIAGLVWRLYLVEGLVAVGLKFKAKLRWWPCLRPPHTHIIHIHNMLSPH